MNSIYPSQILNKAIVISECKIYELLLIYESSSIQK
jgi:hypothetical protein